MFLKTKMKKNYLVAVGMSLVLLFINTLSILLGTGIGQITPPTTDTWDNYVSGSGILGSGTQSDPWHIKSAEEFACFIGAFDEQDTNTYYVYIDNDLDFYEHEWKPINLSLIGGFYIYGQNHTFRNITINQPLLDNVGIFGKCNYLEITDLNISNVSIVGKNHVGIISGICCTEVNIDNVNISGCSVNGNNYIGGVLGGEYNGVRTNNCIINAYVSGNNYVGGVTGVQNYAEFVNTIFTGKVVGEDYVGGLVGYGFGDLQNCYVEADIKGNRYIGGFLGYYNNSFAIINTSGFNGTINATTGNKIGNFIGDFASNAKCKIENCFGVGNFYVKGSNYDVHQFGAEQTKTTFKSSYSYSKLFASDGLKEYRRYKTNAEETEPFSGFAYHKNINGGYPFPKTLFAVGQFIDSDVMSYLEEYGFEGVRIQAGQNSPYVEYGKYPQTYVGDELNENLKSWFTAKKPTSVDSYKNDTGVSGTVTHYAYRYTDGNVYVRVASAIVYGSDYKFGNTKVESGREYWFKVEPIKWKIVNYSGVTKGEAPIVISEYGLTGNITWNKSLSDKNLWTGTCNIRSWLNEQFYNDAFDNFTNLIKTTTVKNCSDSSVTDGSGGNTADKLWLLSYDEINGKYSQFARSTPTNYAMVNNAELYTTPPPVTRFCRYWTRTIALPSVDKGVLSYTYETFMHNVDTPYLSVRPAMTIML